MSNSPIVFSAVQPEHLYGYMAEQFSQLERKSIKPIVMAIDEGNIMAMQRFVSNAPWNNENMTIKYRSLVNDGLGSSDGALIFDETCFTCASIKNIFVGAQGTVGIISEG